MKFLNFKKYIKSNNIYDINQSSPLDRLIERIIEKFNSMKPQAIYCSFPEGINMTNNYTEISTWNQIYAVGTELTVSNGKIKVGKGINNVKVTGKMFANGVNKIVYFYVRKNGTNVSGSWSVNQLDSGTEMVSVTALFPVSEGDIISIAHYGENCSLRESGTTIIVEKID